MDEILEQTKVLKDISEDISKAYGNQIILEISLAGVMFTAHLLQLMAVSRQILNARSPDVHVFFVVNILLALHFFGRLYTATKVGNGFEYEMNGLHKNLGDMAVAKYFKLSPSQIFEVSVLLERIKSAASIRTLTMKLNFGLLLRLGAGFFLLIVLISYNMIV